jgi:hypothetical protein
MTPKRLRALWALPGLVVFIAGLVGEEHPAKATVWQDAPRSMSIAAVPNLPSLSGSIKRNPFDGVPATASPDKSTNVAFAPNVTITPMPGTPANGTNVPNPGANLNVGQTGDPSAVVAAGDAAGMVYVISTVIGDGRPPLAMLRNGDDTDIVGVGDTIGRHRITRIVPQGIEFEDGSRLAVAASPAADGGQHSADGLQSNESPYGNGVSAPQGNTTPAPGPSSGALSGTSSNSSSTQNGIPVINPSPYQFGPLATPQPGTSPAPVPHFYPPPPGTQ